MNRPSPSILIALVLSSNLLAQSTLQWTRSILGGAGPAAREHHQVAYSQSHSQIVAHGGDIGGLIFNDTELWNGITWTGLPSTVPATTHHATAEHSGGTISFGGYTQNGIEVFTWRLSGTSWSSAGSAQVTPHRNDMAMAYDADPADDIVLLFGGREAASTTVLADTWCWNGGTWSSLAPSSSPPGRRDHAMAHDAVDGTIILFGGVGQSGSALSDTWEWDGFNWNPKCPPPGAPAPSARSRHAMATGPNGRPVLFGGNANGLLVNDTWEWDGNAWLPITISGVVPSPRRNHSMALDASRNVVVMFGGHDSNASLQETWELTTSTVIPPGNGQANSADASLKINGVGPGGVNGPFSVDLCSGGIIRFDWSGPPGAPLTLFAGLLSGAPISFAPPADCIGIFELSLSTLSIIADGGMPGVLNSLFVLTGGGTAIQLFTLPVLPPGPLIDLQGLVVQATSVAPPCSFPVLTASFSLSVN